MQVFKLGFSALMGSTAMSVFSLGGSSLLQVYAVEGFTPELVLDFREDKYFLGGAATTLGAATTYAGASASTYTDSSGALQTALAGVPRVGNHVYNGTTWVNEGLLLESEARTNLLLNSATLSTQSTIVTAAPHTLHFTGTGTITLTGASTAGPLVGTGAGENNRVSLTFTPSAATLTVTVSGTVTNGQLEIGSTPSSYIPTSDAAATRAAQTFEIAGADMPAYHTPTYVGSNEYAGVNALGDDTDATTGISSSGLDVLQSQSATTNGSSFAIEASTNVSPSAGARVSVDLFSTLTPGKLYQVSVDVRHVGSGGQWLTLVGSTNSAASGTQLCQINSNDTEFSTYTAVFHHTSATRYFVSREISGTNDGGVFLDNLSFREINPLAVSIAIDGQVTYADTNNVRECEFTRWGSVRSSSLYSALNTTGARSGQVAFYQNNRIFDSVVSDPTFYAPGINVAFNIVSRSGSTFVNGAVDATLLSANTTPTGIADLSAEVFKIGPTFNGNIGTVRVWPEDITDAGIAEAST